MIRSILFTILVFHGLIHLIGFLKEFSICSKILQNNQTLFQLSEVSSKIVGFAGCLIFILFVFSAVVFLFRKDWWWIPAMSGVLLSQIYILIYWNDAKYGTIMNIAIFLAAAISYGNWSFGRMVEKEKVDLLAKNMGEKIILTNEMIHGFPIVQKWLIKSNVIGKPCALKIHLKQKGKMRTKLDGRWMSVEAEQYFTTLFPGFLWIADVKAAPFIHLSGRDKYLYGKGHMLIKVLSLFPVANAKGNQIDQGTLVRFLAEIVWFPSAAVRPYIGWEEIDSLSARATMHFGGIEGSGVFKFNSKGDVLSFEAKRYYDRPQGATMEAWHIEIDEHSMKNLNGITIPTQSSVTWKLDQGDFNWFQLEITHIDYE